MTARVLQHESEIAAGRESLRQAGISALNQGSFLERILRRAGLQLVPPVGDERKSWDVHLTADFIECHVPKTGTVLDLGTYSSEVPYVLKRLGYRSLVGVDLARNLNRMPSAEGLRFVRGDFYRSPFRDGCCDAITAISVIEHGFSAGLLPEISRMLREGGYFIASCDYWPEKIATDGLTAFGLDWRIFSRQEVLELVNEAATHHLHPCGSLELDAADRVIRWNEREYTFAWIVLRKGRA